MSSSILIISGDKTFHVATKEGLQESKTYHFDYGIDALIFSKSCDRIDAAIFDYENMNPESLAYTTLINSFLTKENPEIAQIICVDPSSLENPYVKMLPFKFRIVTTPRTDYKAMTRAISENIRQKEHSCDRKMLNRSKRTFRRMTLSDLPESKNKPYSDFMIRVQISREGIDAFMISFETPASLDQLINYSALVPVAYLEKYLSETKTEKARILGIDRMKYTRLSKTVDNLSKNLEEKADEEMSNIISKV